MRLIHIIASGSMGGVERYALDICREYHSRGDDVIALTRDARAVDKVFAEGGIGLRHAPLRDYPDLFSSLILRDILREKPDVPTVVHVHRYKDALTAIAARIMAKRLDVRIVATRHKCAPGKDNWLRRRIYREIDAHIFVSEFSRDAFLESWPNGRIPFDSRRLHVAYNSLREVPPILPEPERGAITAIYHGRLREGKGLEVLLQAMGIIKREGRVKLRLRIVGAGDPDYADALRRAAMLLNVAEMVDFIGYSDSPSTHLAECHFGVYPVMQPEAFGMANMECMMAGRPQITTFAGPQREYLTPGVEALEIPPGDAEALAESMTSLAIDKNLRLEMGEMAADTYNGRLSWPHFISRIDKVYSNS